MNQTNYLRFKRIQRLCVLNGFDPTNVYCSQTGMPIGRFDESIILDSLTEIGFNMDDDEIVDDLLTRTLSSMRPSPNWNFITKNSLRSRVKSSPTQTLSYLLIRLYEPHANLKVPFESRLRDHLRRVTIYRLLTQVSQSNHESIKSALAEWTYLLVEIDALYNLTTLPVPGNDIVDMLGAIAAEHGAPGFDSQLNLFLQGWRDWHGKLYGEYERKQQAAIRQDQWLKGNPQAAPARTMLFFEQKPKSEATVKRQAKAKDDSEMVVLLRNIMEKAARGIEETETPKPKVISGFIPSFAGLKLNIAPKEA